MTFTSGGHTLLGVLHLPTGPGPHPVVVLLHGFPGNERSFDLARALRRAGYAALVFHYRGSWGVGGSYAQDPAVRAVVSVAAFDLGVAAAACRAVPGAREAYAAAWEDALLPLRGTRGAVYQAHPVPGAAASALSDRPRPVGPPADAGPDRHRLPRPPRRSLKRVKPLCRPLDPTLPPQYRPGEADPGKTFCAVKPRRRAAPWPAPGRYA
ncbi:MULTISPECIES: alpha/beta hydrolase family protein [unclassified Nonomuraea]|uniref:alpha/beta hydrolase family protein n=1 Tax=unclassified Nonomuraea TaxID=2593643 RepID=UPI00191C3DF7|nr:MULTISPECIES: hypothetical protein [unclassified Nonomuraea]